MGRERATAMHLTTTRLTVLGLVAAATAPSVSGWAAGRRQWLTNACAGCFAGAVVPSRATAFWQFWGPDDMLLMVDRYGKQGDTDSVLLAMDKAAETSWMMNIGNEKGLILEQLVREQRAKTVLEIGTFMGYSAIRIVRNLPPDGKLITIEKDAANAAAAKTIMLKSGIDMSKVELLVGSSSDMFGEVQRLNNRRPFDFIFMDHWKEEYRADLERMEKLKFIKRGTTVMADNVIVPGAPAYLEYLNTTAKDRYETTLIDTPFEYRPETPDAMSVSVAL